MEFAFFVIKIYVFFGILVGGSMMIFCIVINMHLSGWFSKKNQKPLDNKLAFELEKEHHNNLPIYLPEDIVKRPVKPTIANLLVDV